MKKLFYQLAISFVFLITPVLLVHSSSILTDNLHLSLTISQDVLVIADLDARDQFNRPIRTSTVQRRFEEFWNQSLTQVLLSSLTPLKLKMLALLQMNWQNVWHFLTKMQRSIQTKVLGFFRAESFRIVSPLCSYMPASRSKNGVIFSTPGFISSYLTLIISSTRILR